MVIMHNLSAMNANRMYNMNTKKKVSTAEKLSSGYRINRAADDAAGLAISEKMRRQIRGLTQGVENTQDGISMCQVADGALNEVNDMLHRITELSVKAANGTCTDEDRGYIQEEVQQLLEEINRIGDTTTFNEQPVFKGTDTIITNADGTPATNGSVPFSDFTLADVALGNSPLKSGDGGDTLHLKAIVKNEDSALNGKTFNLIFGDGSTSNSSVRITDANGNKIIVGMDELQATNFQTNGTNTWSREFSYSSDTGLTVGIKQIVSVVDTSADEKNYIISYEFTKSADVADVEFMFHVDTAYNNNDRCEGYYVGGNRVNQYCVYNKDAAASDLIGANNSSYVQNGSMPSSFSIVDVDNALAFSEKISFASGEEPDSLSIGHYNAIDEWTYYNSLDRNLGQNTNRSDLGFSLYYDLDDLTTKNSISFSYGIVSTGADTNLAGVTVNADSRAAVDHSGKKSVWIQSGAEATSGLWLEIDEMNTDVLGLRGVDVSTQRGAGDAISRIKGALQKVSTNRSVIGAQQNRMEHIIANEENIVENTTAAESRIRDTDMATEMVRLSNLNILTQAGEILLAQANQSKQGVMSLLG